MGIFAHEVITDLGDEIPPFEFGDPFPGQRKIAERAPTRFPQIAPVESLSPEWLTAASSARRGSSAAAAAQ